jgi:hypothetical protein
MPLESGDETDDKEEYSTLFPLGKASRTSSMSSVKIRYSTDAGREDQWHDPRRMKIEELSHGSG